MPHLPALITSGDVMPGGGDLNGRRWAGHQLLRAWARFAGDSPLALAHADPQSLLGLQPWLEESGFKGQLKPMGLVHPQPFATAVGCFCRIHRLAAGLSGVRPPVLMRFP